LTLLSRNFKLGHYQQAGSIHNWDGMGDAGLVYDANGRKVWDGIIEGCAGRLGTGN
jgi:hypothetical protein